jgi:hypothetical protein
MLSAKGQDEAAYLKSHAVVIDNPERLSDSVYTLLSSFQIIMFGEMHGTNESAPFVKGLAELFLAKGDSVQVGLEIPPELMTKFILLHTDSSVYQSDFFSNPPVLDGKESIPWAHLIETLNRNPKVKIFFFDVNAGEKKYDRDSLMAAKTKTQFDLYPRWKIITLSGNYHNKIDNVASMISVLKRNVTAKICSLDMEYKEGSAYASFNHGLEIKQLGSYPSVYNSTPGLDRYLILLPGYNYDGIYYTKSITPARLVKEK